MMSYLVKRQNTVLRKSGSYMIPAQNFYVTAYPVGAQIGTNNGDGTFVIKTGHGLADTNKVMAMSGDAMIAGSLRSVVGVPGATTVTLDSNIAGAASGDYLVNLGTADSGTGGAPTFDGSPLATYTTMDNTGTPVSRAEFRPGADGQYTYWHPYSEVWELVRDDLGAPVKLWMIPSGNVVGPAAAVTDNQLVRFDGTSGQHIQGYTSTGPTVTDGGAVSFPSTLAVTGDTTLTGALSVGTTLGVTGVATLSANLLLSAALKLSSASVTISSTPTNITTANRGLIQITNSTGANTITLSAPSSVDGQILILFVVAITSGSLTLANTGTVKLSAAWSATALDTLTLVAVGSIWYELARSVN